MTESRQVPVRRAAPEDAASVQDLLQAAFEPYRSAYTAPAFQDTVPSLDDVRTRIERMPVFLAEFSSGAACGTVGGEAVGAGEGHIRGMAVRPDCEGRGIARSLLRAIEGELGRSGCTHVTLDTTAPLARAMSFYEQQGYRRSGKVRDFFGMDLFEYVKTLPSLEDRVRLAIQEDVAVVPYNPRWPTAFAHERDHLRRCLPPDLIGRIEHFGSTAVPGLAAKPVIDVLVEVTSLAGTRARIVPILEAQGYEYFWRPTHGDDGPPFYAWFIKRDAAGVRTHHLHLVEASFAEHWNRLLFRDYLIAHPQTADEYGALKQKLAGIHARDRVSYTKGKHEFIAGVMKKILSSDVSRRGAESAEA